MIPIQCGMNYTVEGRRCCVSSRQALHQLGGFLGLKRQKAWKRMTRHFSYSNLLRILASVLTERMAHCLRKFGSSVFFSFVLFSKVK